MHHTHYAWKGTRLRTIKLAAKFNDVDCQSDARRGAVRSFFHSLTRCHIHITAETVKGWARSLAPLAMEIATVHEMRR